MQPHLSRKKRPHPAQIRDRAKTEEMPMERKRKMMMKIACLHTLIELKN